MSEKPLRASSKSLEMPSEIPLQESPQMMIELPVEITTETPVGLTTDVPAGPATKAPPGPAIEISVGLATEIPPANITETSVGVAAKVLGGPATEASFGLDAEISAAPTIETSVGVAAEIPIGINIESSHGFATEAPIVLAAETPAGLGEVPVGIAAEVPTGLVTEVPAGLATEVPVRLADKVPTDLVDKVPTGIDDKTPVGLAAEVPAGIATEMSAELAVEIPAIINTEIPTGVSAEAPVGMDADITPNYTPEQVSENTLNVSNTKKSPKLKVPPKPRLQKIKAPPKPKAPKNPPKPKAPKITTVKTIAKKPRAKKWSLDVLMHDPNSELGNADLKSLIDISTIEGLTAEDREELSALLPICDKSYLTKDGWKDEPSLSEAKVYSTTCTKTSLNSFVFNPKNEIFWDNVKYWQDRLKNSEFVIEQSKSKEDPKRNDTGSTGAKSEAPWKDDAFEAYWGERLERDRELKRSFAKIQEVSVPPVKKPRGRTPKVKKAI
ncbi:Asx homology domain-containing protein [Phycomyces nitens]|nr:Asx homology domain-containing protein [Phycomyces nitens]